MTGYITPRSIASSLARGTSRTTRTRTRTPRARWTRRAPIARAAASEHVYRYETIDLGTTLGGIDFKDLSEHIDRAIERAGVREGAVHVISRHTTTAVTINENEERLIDDARMNCHSHLLSMLIGNSAVVPVSEGKTTLGTWQSVMFVELDGPRERTVGIQVVGIK
ncbi:hypothetical protein BE221DRAFT_211065 [Ostreococcus tauri]|uniref:YjbQ family protein n=1 Tax=Ostreococcus tauri TaxID=70448 RepID=A0A1Y5IJ17_OSTTA|nr:hypothetical protein BE221DRAFT_211065 [Ostreococcus tauri]